MSSFPLPQYKQSPNKRQTQKNIYIQKNINIFNIKKMMK